MDTLPHEKQIQEILQAIERLKKQGQDTPLFRNEIAKLEQKLHSLREVVYSNLTAWERVQISRHPSRPHTIDYINNLCDHFRELAGDRLFGEDRSLIGGLATIQGMRCMVIGQEKGKDTQTRLERNFGMLSPEGYRKALRLMQMAEKFKLPVVCLIDTPGANPCLEAEERGQGSAIAFNLREMARLTVPLIVVIIGEGCSGGALGIGVGDVVAMLEHSYYTVITPEGCASILWKDASKKEEAAATLRLNAEFLLEQGIIDHIIKEPVGGAHCDPQAVYSAVRSYLMQQWQILRNIPAEILVRQRYHKFRSIGAHATLNQCGASFAAQEQLKAEL